VVVALEIEKGEGNSDDVIDLTVCLISGHQPMENLVRHTIYIPMSVLIRRLQCGVKSLLFP